MNSNHTPIRRCIGCGKRASKSEFIKIVRTRRKNGSTEISICLGHSDGRGAYLCKDYECFKKARKMRKVERAFSGKVEECVYNQIEGMVLGTEQQSNVIFRDSSEIR